jgi:predicted amidohydrolase YtcJ
MLACPMFRQAEMEDRVITAHKVGFPMVIHQNGDQAISDTVEALKKAQGRLPSSRFSRRGSACTIDRLGHSRQGEAA